MCLNFSPERPVYVMPEGARHAFGEEKVWRREGIMESPITAYLYPSYPITTLTRKEEIPTGAVIARLCEN